MVCEGGNPVEMQDKRDNKLLVNTDDMNFLSLLLFFSLQKQRNVFGETLQRNVMKKKM